MITVAKRKPMARPTGQAGAVYAKLIRKGMTPKQARAFAAQAAKRMRGK